MIGERVMIGPQWAIAAEVAGAKYFLNASLADVPSDQLPTGTSTVVYRPIFSSCASKGTSSPKPDPNALGSISGTKNITWGSHGPLTPAFKYPCLDNM